MLIEFTRRYAMAHRLLADKASKCATPHGHNETVTVTLRAPGRFTFGAANMAAPFETLKKRWHGWIDGAVDHAFQLSAEDPLIAWFRAHEPERLASLLITEGDPTTEALAACFWLKLQAFLEADAPGFQVESVRIEETPTNAVLLTAKTFSPEAAAASLRKGSWPLTPDMRINDL